MRKLDEQNAKAEIKIKRYNNIYEKIYSKDNLLNAFNKCKKNKNNMKEINNFINNKDFYINELHNILKNKKFKTSKYKIYRIIDRGKPREIYDLPFYPDRIVHWAIMLQIEDIFINNFIFDTYAAIPNKGGHLALSRMTNELNNNPKECEYCLKIDIRKYFPNIDQNILSNMVRKKIKDKDLLCLLDDIIFSTESGLPIGNYTSQYFGNFYLSYFDHWCKEALKLKRYYRYMDDVVILHESKEYLHELKLKFDKYLDDNLKIKIKDNWQIFPTFIRGIDFIGYRNFGKYILLRKSTLKRMKHKFKNINKYIKKYDKINHNYWCSINSYHGWTKWCNDYRLYEKYFKSLEPYCKKYYEEVIL